MPSAKSQKPTILMVDDRAENLLALSATLDDVGAHIIEAQSGESALSHLLENDIALVLLDVQMPGMDGYEVASIMRETPATTLIPIIFLTAISTDEMRVEQAYHAGAVDFISKPINADILLAKVSVFLKMWSQSHELKLLAKSLEQALAKITQQRDQLKELATKDYLTGLYQRRECDAMMVKEISRSVCDANTLTVVMLDLDHFKSVNDNYGHLVGDEVIISTANILTEIMRAEDFICRFGGEEFVVLMPNTKLSEAQVVAERVRASIENTAFVTEHGHLNATISIGLAEFNLSTYQTPEQLLKIADDCLYKAKGNGRNQIYPQA